MDGTLLVEINIKKKREQRGDKCQFVLRLIIGNGAQTGGNRKDRR